MRDLRRCARAVLGSIAAALIVVLAMPHAARADGGSPSTTEPAGKAEDADYAAGVKAIRAQDFRSAIKLLQGVVARDARNADAYNWLGYAMRRSGDAAGSIPLYQKALAIDPKHRGAHEYIGEAYLQLDDVPKAKQHLATLNSLCAMPCSEYADLKTALDAYEKSGGKVKPTASSRQP